MFKDEVCKVTELCRLCLKTESQASLVHTVLSCHRVLGLPTPDISPVAIVQVISRHFRVCWAVCV